MNKLNSSRNSNTKQFTSIQDYFNRRFTVAGDYAVFSIEVLNDNDHSTTSSLYRLEAFTLQTSDPYLTWRHVMAMTSMAYDTILVDVYQRSGILNGYLKINPVESTRNSSFTFSMILLSVTITITASID